MKRYLVFFVTGSYEHNYINFVNSYDSIALAVNAHHSAEIFDTHNNEMVGLAIDKLLEQERSAKVDDG